MCVCVRVRACVSVGGGVNDIFYFLLIPTHIHVEWSLPMQP